VAGNVNGVFSEFYDGKQRIIGGGSMQGREYNEMAHCLDDGVHGKNWRPFHLWKADGNGQK
jgi:hypothetical protein